MADKNGNMKPSDQVQYHEPRHPILYIILYSVGTALCVMTGLLVALRSTVDALFNDGFSTGPPVLAGWAIAIVGPLVIIYFFLRTFKTSRLKKYYLIPLIAIPAAIIAAYLYI